MANLGKIAAKTTIQKVQSMPYLVDAQALVYLETKPNINNSYLDRIRAARTEKELDLVWRDFTQVNQSFGY